VVECSLVFWFGAFYLVDQTLALVRVDSLLQARDGRGEVSPRGLHLFKKSLVARQ
jgi:hypothetical protein